MITTDARLFWAYRLAHSTMAGDIAIRSGRFNIPDNVVLDLGDGLYQAFATLEWDGRDLVHITTLATEGLQLHMTGVVWQHQRHVVYEAESKELFQRCITRYPLAMADYKRDPVLSQWIEELTAE